jgi:ArsR family transcriptional regulator
MAKICRALGDPTRLALLSRIGRGEVCVCDLQAEVGRDQPTVSRHLAVLRSAGLVTVRKEGRWSYYRRAALPRHLAAIIDLAAPTKSARNRRCCR